MLCQHNQQDFFPLLLCGGFLKAALCSTHLGNQESGLQLLVMGRSSWRLE